MKYLVIILNAILMTGCATSYQPPTNGEVATFKVQNDSMKNVKIAIYEESTNCKRRKVLPEILPTTNAEHIINSGKELTFQYYIFQPSGQYCLLNLRFNPEPNHAYIFKTSEDINSCKWIMTDVTNADMPTPVTLKVIPWKRGFAENSSFCSG